MQQYKLLPLILLLLDLSMRVMWQYQHKNQINETLMQIICKFLIQVLLKTNPAQHQRSNEIFLVHIAMLVGSIWKNKSG
jgi:hypothetical protein